MPGISPWMIKNMLDCRQCLSLSGHPAFALGTPFRPAYFFGHGLDYLAVKVGGTSAALDPVGQVVTVAATLTNGAPAAMLCR